MNDKLKKSLKNGNIKMSKFLLIKYKDEIYLKSLLNCKIHKRVNKIVLNFMVKNFYYKFVECKLNLSFNLFILCIIKQLKNNNFTFIEELIKDKNVLMLIQIYKRLKDKYKFELIKFLFNELWYLQFGEY